MVQYVLHWKCIHKCNIGFWDDNHLKCSHRIHYFHTSDLILIAVAKLWEKCHWPICLVKSPQRWICGAWQWELSLCGDSTQSVVHWQSVLTIQEKRKYDTNVLINLFSIRHSQGQSTLEPVREKMENERRKKKMNSEDINTAVNISIIHIHFKALQHNKAVPISHLNF